MSKVVGTWVMGVGSNIKDNEAVIKDIGSVQNEIGTLAENDGGATLEASIFKTLDLSKMRLELWLRRMAEPRWGLRIRPQWRPWRLGFGGIQSENHEG